ncbi:MAG: Acetyl esterase Axe7A precursor [Bacteroidota bacterium]|jgi:cephalosporin-C deacetylase-like acetyl esterase
MYKKSLISILLLSILLVSNVIAENYPFKSDYLWYAVPNHADWIYKTGENAIIDVMFLKYGIPQDGIIEYEIANELCISDTKGSVTLKDGKAIINAGTSKEPGFRDIRLKLKSFGTTYEHHVKIGFSPEKIVPYTQEPSDFKEWWNKNIAENSKQPLKYSKELYKPYCTENVDCYLVKLEVSEEHQAFYGFLLCPKLMKKAQHPVVLCPPGAGIKANRDPQSKNYYPENGCIRFVVEIHGINPTYPEEVYEDIRSAFDGRIKGYLYQGLDNRDHYYMKHVYLGLVKCIDFLTSLPEWDGKNVIVQGGSQGGGLAIVAAGLDNRVTQCVVNHPALADMARGKKGGASGFPHFSEKEQLLTEANMQTIAYFDVVNFAKYVRAKTFMTWGYNDNTCPPTTSYAVWNTLKCEKEKLVTPINEHWTSETTNRLQLDWIIEHLNRKQ